MEVSQPSDHITHAVIGGAKTIDFGISNSAEFFQILSSTLYTDQHLAVVREVLCNAWDAHIDSGRTNKHIDVTIDDTHLTVRDFGFGIPHDDIGPIYGVYGGSTKKNDQNSTGGFGLGCKAPFAYTDHFEVTSYNNGTKTIYSMSKSSAQALGKPGIVPLARMPTTETGLAVRIPILTKDRHRFVQLIRRITENGEMRVMLNNSVLECLPFSTATEGYFMTTRDLLGDHIDDRILLRYGTVIYPVPEAAEYAENYRKVLHLLDRPSDTYSNKYKVVLQAEPDTISVTPSREALSLQEHTLKTIGALLEKFLYNTADLEQEILKQAQAATEATIDKKNYKRLFDDRWGFATTPYTNITDILDLPTLAKKLLTRNYPSTLRFRVNDVQFRVKKAAEKGLLDKTLAACFLKELPQVKSLPSAWGVATSRHRSDWLHREVLGKLVTKLSAAELDPMGLYLIDSKDPGSLKTNSSLIPIRDSHSRHLLCNLPYLRKFIVVTTALTTVRNRLAVYSSFNQGVPEEGLLCYRIQDRKGNKIEKAINLFTKLGYEVINLTVRQSWEEQPQRAPKEKKKYDAGLPALSCLLTPAGALRTSRFRDEDTVVINPVPEFVMLVPSRTEEANFLGFKARASVYIARQYGDRVGIAKDQIEYKRALKFGTKDFMEFLESEVLRVLPHSPNVRKYYAYSYNRVIDSLTLRGAEKQALALIYHNKELRNLFNIQNNLTEEEQRLVTIFQQSYCFSTACTRTIRDYISSIPLAPENQEAVKAVSGNELLSILDLASVRLGLLSDKRQTYIDILTKVFKG